MKKNYFLFLFVFATILSSCTTTRYGMERATLDAAIDDIKEEYNKNGFNLTSEVTGQAISTQISNTRDARNSIYEADKANAKADVYSFQDTIGNTLKFIIAYNEALQDKTMYLLDVSTIACETSNPNDYAKLCGKNSPVGTIKQIPQNKEVTVGDSAKTTKAVLWSCLGVCIAAVIWSLSSIY